MSIIKKLIADKKRIGLVISIALIIIGLIPLIKFVFYADANHPYKIKQVTLESRDGTMIEALVYKPRGKSEEGIVVGHGYCGNKQYMQSLSIELVKRGFTVVSIDFRGHGSSDGYLLAGDDKNRYDGLVQDMEAAIDYLEDHDDIKKYGVVGHSMGGHTAVETAEDNTNIIDAVVSIGHIPNEDYYNFSLVPNLLVGIGQFEQTMTEKDALEFLEDYTGKYSVKTGKLYGDFDDRDACKVVIGTGSEHLAGVLNPKIIEEMVKWFELAFNDREVDNVHMTFQYLQLSYIITIIGVVSLLFVILIYLSNYIFKREFVYPEKEILNQDISIKKLSMYYVISMFIGVIISLPLTVVFTSVISISSGNSLFALLVGFAIGMLLIYYLLILRKEKLGITKIPSKFKDMCSTNLKKSLMYGAIAGLLFIASISLVSHWSTQASIPTLREILIMLWIIILFFPFLMVKEFNLRMIQGRLNESSRLKEYFKMTGIAIFIDNIVFVPIMLLLWGSDFLALALTVVILFSIMQQILVTWVYMHSGRNILGSTLFLCIFYSWMIINFFPFGFN